MPTPPREGESKQVFISRCLSYMAKHESDKPLDQRQAICFSMWER